MEPDARRNANSRWVRVSPLGRVGFALLALGLAAVFAAAGWITPWDAAGQPLQMGTHEQLGLPPCMFHEATGWPCPTCGMTTSFSLLVHGEVRAAFTAHPVAALLALFSLISLPAVVWVAVTGYGLRMPQSDWWLVVVVVALFVAILVTWGVRLLVWWWGG